MPRPENERAPEWARRLSEDVRLYLKGAIEDRRRAEADRRRAEEDRRRAEEDRKRADIDRHRAEEDRRNVDADRKELALFMRQSMKRAEVDRHRAEEDRKRAEQDREDFKLDRRNFSRLMAYVVKTGDKRVRLTEEMLRTLRAQGNGRHGYGRRGNGH
ncbi:MAG: hypothetical protein HY716_16990 [Planctomycetes bacterium]|nr:hypothetical protein [Planctomycetota bacterium]